MLRRFKIKVFCYCWFVFLSGMMVNAEDFRLIEQWNHEGVILAPVQELTVDEQGCLVGGFASPHKSKLVIGKDKIVCYAQHGQGPSDLINLAAIFPYQNDLAISEMQGKVKVFTRKGDTYVWKATKWFRNDYNTQIVRDALVYNDKWFFAGQSEIHDGKLVQEGKKYKVFYIKVYNDEGRLVKNLLYEEMVDNRMAHLMEYFIDVYKDRLFFMKENHLNIRVVDLNELVEKDPIPLTPPSFYKKIPPDFYQFNASYSNKFANLKKDLEHWAINYSAVTKMLVEGDKIVLQIRTCSQDLKKFALLFYNASTFKLEETIYTDDFLVASKNGKYYFIADGNPSLDDDVEDCAIKIYAFK